MKKLVFCLLVSLLINLTFGKEYIWQWHRIDCTYKQNIESLFEHCSPMEQEFIEEAKKNTMGIIGQNCKNGLVVALHKE